MQWVEETEYEKYFSEPSDVEYILAEALERMEDYFTDCVKDTLRKAKEADKRLSELQLEIAFREHKKEALDKELHDKENLIVETDKKVPQKYVNAFVRDVIGDFAPGDRCWTLRYESSVEKCPTCHGETKVSASINGDTVLITCPTCHGSGIISHPNYYPVERRIERIDLRMCFSAGQRNVAAWSPRCILLSSGEELMSTNGIYKTREEAEAAAKERNQK